MSKERQLLKEIMSYIAKGGLAIIASDSDVGETLHDAKELLDKPEQYEQEPVAWIIGDDIFYSYQERGVPLYTSPHKPLYTSPQKHVWYCPTCDEEVDPRNVTYYERHASCGTFL